MNVVAPVLPGETLGGKYRVERILGQGGMGVVVAAKHIDLDERVAIKFLLGDPSTTAVDRFLREARAAVKVKGEHICRVLDFGRLDTGEPYIVMEHLDGIDLAKKLASEGAQSVSASVGWIIEASDALAEAHALGIVHRDVKPANIFLARRRDGTTSAKVLDFGISKLASQTQLTGTQSPMGSPSYMSPEQMVSAHDVDARTDIWSLGVTLYELLSGKPPFTADSLVQLSVIVREREPAPLDGIPQPLMKVIARCLAKDPAERYASVAALVADLAPFAPEETGQLVRRHGRRSTSADPAALAATTPDVAAASGEIREATPGTFAPLQSTLAEGRMRLPARRRRWPLLALAAAVVAALGAGAAALSRAPATAPVASSSTLQEAAAPTADHGEVGRADGAAPPGTSTALSAPSAGPTTASSSGAARPRDTTTTTSKPSLPPQIAPAGTPRSAAPTAAVDAGEAPAQATSAASSPPAPKPADSRKRRELDRDDP